MNKGLLSVFVGLAVGVFAFATVAQAQETVISGFVDMSYFSDTNADTAGFGMDQAEVDITHTVNDKASLRIDLNYLATDGITYVSDVAVGVDSGDVEVDVVPTTSSAAVMAWDEIVEQGYITINAGAITLTFGKFNAPIGFELLDAPDMYQYSHAMVFDYGLPGNLTGVMASGGSGIIDYAVYVVNGWDNNTDDNTDKHIGGRLGVTPSEGINVGLSYISGNVGTDPNKVSQTVMDIDFTYTRQENLTIGAEYNMGTVAESSVVDPGDDATWTAYLVMAHYDFSDKFGVTARYDSFNDEDGLALGAGVKEIRNAITVAPTFAIAEGLGGLIEWKTTTSDEKVFKDKDGKDVDSEQTLAAELTFSF